MKSLIIGQDRRIMIETYSFLEDAGQDVDLITTHKFFKHAPALKSYYYIRNSAELIKKIKGFPLSQYTLIVIADDPTISLILNSSLPHNIKLKLLPVLSSKNYMHLCSKVGLAKIFTQFKVSQPNYKIINSNEELEKIIRDSKVPHMAKIDFSTNGEGVFDLSLNTDVNKLFNSPLLRYPLLIQERISGQHIDLSAFFQNGNLIYFSYSVIEKRAGDKYSASSVRSFFAITKKDKNIFRAISKIGKALGAHGFTNISGIQSFEDKKIYFYEADVRPTAWIKYPSFIGINGPNIVRDFFYSKTSNFIDSISQAPERKILVPHIYKLHIWELACNKYNCWNFIGDTSLPALLKELLMGDCKYIVTLTFSSLRLNMALTQIKSIYRKFSIGE